MRVIAGVLCLVMCIAVVDAVTASQSDDASRAMRRTRRPTISIGIFTTVTIMFTLIGGAYSAIFRLERSR
jgi:hypothetical protein